MREIKGEVYSVSSQLGLRGVLVECKGENEIVEYVATRFQGGPAEVVRVFPDGTRRKVAIYSNPYYKKLLQQRG